LRKLTTIYRNKDVLVAGSINEKVKYLKSQFDAPQTAVKSFQDNINAVRTISVNNYIQDYFSRAIPVYTNGSVTRVKFYRDDSPQAETLTFRNNLSEFLVGKFLIIKSGANRRTFVVLYDNASNDAVDPGIPDAELIRVELVNNDDADIVGAATKIALEATKEFKITGTNNRYEIVNIEKGFTTQIDVGDTGFVSQNVIFGVTKLLKDVPIKQIPGYRYVYNELSSNFELFRTQGDLEVDLDHTEDSIRLGDGTDFFTSTTVNSDIGLDVHLINEELDVNITNASIEVTATDLDIRDLDAASDSVSAHLADGSGTALTSTLVNTSQALDVNIVDQVIWDAIEITFPSDSSELFTYKKEGDPVQTVLVTYQNVSKKVIISINKTRL